MSPPSDELLLFDVVSDDEFALPEVAVPDVDPLSSPPEVRLLAWLSASEPPPLASELLLLEALPLPSTLASLLPPLPPLAPALASPESPDCASASPLPEAVPPFVLSQFPLELLVYASAHPVLPERAVLVASPPSASWFCVTSPPSAELSLFDVVVELDLAFPDVAEPDGSCSPDDVVFFASLCASEPPPLALDVLLFEALPLSSTLASLRPPLPPLALAFASPESPDSALASPLPELADAPPVPPDVAVLVASPPFASWF